MAAARLMLLRSSRPLDLSLPSSSSSSLSSSSSSGLKILALSSSEIIRCFRESAPSGEKRQIGAIGKKKPSTAVAATESVITSEPQTNRGGVDDLASPLANVTATAFLVFKVVSKPRPWKFLAQMHIERVIIDCRFFTLFAVVGSLIGSILCFVEGCFIILESYLHYFHALSQRSDQGHVVQLLLEAIDMFLVGTALLTFGMGLYIMFIGSKYLQGNGSQLPTSNLFGLFYLKTLPRWMGMQSVAQAKSKIGQAVVMILQVGVLEKFKSIPLVTGLDLACFAGALLVSSACIFLLSRLSGRGTDAIDR
ncbi:hypothetical protein U1Q18_016201 [Sarracenia purpurea var. burkii]